MSNAWIHRHSGKKDNNNKNDFVWTSIVCVCVRFWFMKSLICELAHFVGDQIDMNGLSVGYIFSKPTPNHTIN